MPSSRQPDLETPEPARKRGVISSLSKQLSEVASVPDIREGARAIRTYRRLLSLKQELLIETETDGRIDVLGSALLHGLSEREFLVFLSNRRRTAARTAYLFMGAGLISFAAWAYSIWHMVSRPGRILALVEFAPFCMAFFLLAFSEAWRNWQIRTMRMGTPGDYLRTNDSFMPR